MTIKGLRRMSFKKMLRSNRGISPILATLLLIVIAVAAIVVTYAWITTYMGNTTEQAGVLLYKANVNFMSDDRIAIDIGNSGTSNTQIVSVYIGTSSTSMSSQPTDPEIPIPVVAGASPASFTVAYVWEAGTTYYFRVVPTAGTQSLTFQEKAPS
jgi:flagellin-like protein